SCRRCDPAPFGFLSAARGEARCYAPPPGKALLSAMPQQRPNPLSHILGSAAATVARPLHGAIAAALSFFRGGRDPTIDSRQAAALAGVDKRQWSAPLLKQLEWRRFEEL